MLKTYFIIILFLFLSLLYRNNMINIFYLKPFDTFIQLLYRTLISILYLIQITYYTGITIKELKSYKIFKSYKNRFKFYKVNL